MHKGLGMRVEAQSKGHLDDGRRNGNLQTDDELFKSSSFASGHFGSADVRRLAYQSSAT